MTVSRFQQRHLLSFIILPLAFIIITFHVLVLGTKKYCITVQYQVSIQDFLIEKNI